MRLTCNTGYGYDALGNLLSINYPLSTINYSYDSLNRLTNMVDAIGTTAFTWTDGGQLACEDGPWNADTVGYVYNNRLRSGMSLAQPNASAWTQTYAYDDMGRLTGIVSAAGTFGYEYSGFDLVAYLNLPTGGRIYNQYDEVGRLLSTTLQDAQFATINAHQYGYDMGSQRTQQVFTAGNFVDYTYDNIGQLKTATGLEPDGQGGQTPRLHEQFGYAYDAAWNLNYRTNNQLVQAFGVNNLNELTTAGRSGTLTVAGTATERRANYPGDYGVTGVTVSGTGLSSGAAELYADGLWARAGATLADGQNSYTATAQDSYGRSSQDSATVNLPTSTSFSYDGNGNLLSDGRRYFEYDCENQLTNIYVSGQWRSEFSYDGLLRRRARREYAWSGGAWVKTNEVRYVYDARVVVQERDANNLPQVSYTRGNDLSGSAQGAGGIGGLLARTDHSTLNPQLSTSFYHCDGNGNITCLINLSNAIVAQYSYDPYGSMLAASGPLAQVNLYRFSSKECHPNSCTAYYLYRYYDHNLQRWLNRDPLEEEGGLNMLAFLANDPMDAVDSFGLASPNPPMEYPPLPGVWHWCPDPRDARLGKFRNDKGESVSWDPKYSHWDHDNGRGTRTRLNRHGAPMSDAEAHRPMRPTRPFPKGPGGNIRAVGGYLWILDILMELLNELERAQKAHENGMPYWQQLEKDIREAENTFECMLGPALGNPLPDYPRDDSAPKCSPIQVEPARAFAAAELSVYALPN